MKNSIEIGLFIATVSCLWLWTAIAARDSTQTMSYLLAHDQSLTEIARLKHENIELRKRLADSQSKSKAELTPPNAATKIIRFSNWMSILWDDGVICTVAQEDLVCAVRKK